MFTHLPRTEVARVFFDSNTGNLKELMPIQQETNELLAIFTTISKKAKLRLSS